MSPVDRLSSPAANESGFGEAANSLQQLAILLGRRSAPTWPLLRYAGRLIGSAGDLLEWARRAHLVAGTAYFLLLTGVFRLAAVWEPTYNSNLMALQCKAAALLAAGLAMLAAPLLVRRALQPPVGRRWMGELLGVAAAAALIAWFIGQAGLKQIGGFDHSILINTGWLQFQGQRPYQDFPCTLPPFFFLGAKYAFQWGGVAWLPLVLLCAAWSLISFGWSYVLLRLLRFSAVMSLLLAVTLQAMTMMLASYWWYNPPLSIAATLLFLSALVWSNRPRSRGAFCSFLAAGLIVFLNKPNGWPLIVLTEAIFLASAAHRKWAALALLLGAGSVLLIAQLAGFSLPGMLQSYREIACSRNPLTSPMVYHGPVEDRTLGFLLLAALLGAGLANMLLLCVGNASWRKMFYSSDSLLCGAVAVCSAAMYLTNGETKLIDLAPMTAGVILATFRNIPAAASIPGVLHHGVRLAETALLFFLLLASLVLGWQRYRVRAIGPEMFFQAKLAEQAPPLPFFRHVQSGPRLCRIVEEIGVTLAQYPKQTVYFGPRMEWAYAAFSRPLPPHLPIWWDTGTAYPKSAETPLIECWERSQFDLLIFLQRRGQPVATYLPKRLLADIERQYRRAESGGEIVVYRRRR